MATIFPPRVRNFDPVQVMWTVGEYVLAGPSKASIHGTQGASFLSAGAGAETISIGVGSGAPVVVTSLGSEAVVGDWVNTINGTPGLAGVAIEDEFNGIRLGHTSRVRVTAYGGSGGAISAYEVIGLPIQDRDAGAGASSVISVGPSPNLHQVSSEIAVPNDANRVALATTGEGFADREFIIPYLLAWNNGTIGQITPTTSATYPLFDMAPGNTLGPGSVSGDGLESQSYFAATAIKINKAGPPNGIQLISSIEIPPGMTALRVNPTQSKETAGDGGNNLNRAEVPNFGPVWVLFATR